MEAGSLAGHARHARATETRGWPGGVPGAVTTETGAVTMPLPWPPALRGVHAALTGAALLLAGRDATQHELCVVVHGGETAHARQATLLPSRECLTRVGTAVEMVRGEIRS